MRPEDIDILRSPTDLKKISIKRLLKSSHNYIFKAKLISTSSHSFNIEDGIANFVVKSLVSGEASKALKYYNGIHNLYDEYLPIAFDLFNVDELETRLKLIDETKTERNRRMCTSASTIELSTEAMKTGLWNERVSIMNIQGNRGKRRWTYKLTEPKKKKQYNQNTLTEMEGFSRKIEEKKSIPQTMEQIKKEINREENKQQLHITK